MKKSVGIITICRANNYGAELQAFALQHKLKLMGYRSEIIDYLWYKHKEYVRDKEALPFYPYPAKERLKELVLPILEKTKCLRNWTAYKEREKGFEDFHKLYTDFSKRYRSLSELYENVPQYDAYCVGSDQVWNPSCYTSLWPYFLTFAPKDKRRFSYASSFGVSDIPEVAKSQYRKGLMNLEYISVRESSGIKIVKDLCGREAQNVLDPTLLLNADEWKEIANTSKVPKGEYILLYVLSETPAITNIALKLSQDTGMKVVRICKWAVRQDSKSSPIINVIDAAPDDFIGLFRNANVVLTNSFHGTAFSLIFNRDFYTILKRGKETNVRFESLLPQLGIDRIKYADEPFQTSQSINWAVAMSRLEDLRQQSLIYLSHAIG